MGRTSRPKASRLTMLLTVCLLALAGSGYWVTTTPHYALYRLDRAVAEHDLAAFRQGVDTPAIIQNAVDSLMDEAAGMVWGTPGQSDVWRDVGRRLTDSAMETLKPQLRKWAVLAFTDQLEGKWLALSDTRHNRPHLELQDVAWQGSVAKVTIRLNGIEQPVSFVMVRGGNGHWRVVVIDKALMKQAIRMARESGGPD